MSDGLLQSALLLRAAGLPELIAASPDEYEALALTLARDPERLAAIKGKLGANRESCALFDTARMTRNLEAAYVGIWERSQRGVRPEIFGVQGVPLG